MHSSSKILFGGKPKISNEHSIPAPGVSSDLPEWGKFRAGWGMWYQLPCSHPQTWGKFLPWRTAGWWQSQLQHPPSPLGVWDPAHSSLPQDGLWGILHTETYLNHRSFKRNSDQNLQYQYGGTKHTSNTDVKVIIELRSNMFNKVDGVVEAFLLLLPICSNWVCGDITIWHLEPYNEDL